MYRGGLIRHPRGLAGHRTEAVAQEPQSLGRWEPNLGHSGEGHQVGSQRLLPAAANGGWDAAECEDGDASQMWSWKVPGANDLSHGSAQDSAAGCWASGGGLSQLHTGLIKGYEQNRFPHILCSFARLRDPITFQGSASAPSSFRSYTTGSAATHERPSATLTVWELLCTQGLAGL